MISPTRQRSSRAKAAQFREGRVLGFGKIGKMRFATFAATRARLAGRRRVKGGRRVPPLWHIVRQSSG